MLSHEISSPLTKALSHKDICQLSFPRGIMVILEDVVCGAVELVCILLKGVSAYLADTHWYKQDGKKIIQHRHKQQLREMTIQLTRLEREGECCYRAIVHWLWIDKLMSMLHFFFPLSFHLHSLISRLSPPFIHQSLPPIPASLSDKLLAWLWLYVVSFVKEQSYTQLDGTIKRRGFHFLLQFWIAAYEIFIWFVMICLIPKFTVHNCNRPCLVIQLGTIVKRTVHLTGHPLWCQMEIPVYRRKNQRHMSHQLNYITFNLPKKTHILISKSRRK